MQVNQKSKVILEEIDLCRDELNNLVITAYVLSEQVLVVSRKLDKLILNYYKENQSDKI